MFQDMVIPTGSTGEGEAEFKFEILSNSGNAYNSRTRYSIDVKSVLPDYYDKLTLDNFSLDSVLTPAHNGTQVTADSALFLDYDSSTGILSTGIRSHRISIGSTYYYLYYTYKVKVCYVG